MEFQEKLDGIWKRISDPLFLENKGAGNEVRYFVFDYDPSDELIVRQKVQNLKKQKTESAIRSRNTCAKQQSDAVWMKTEELLHMR